LYGPFETWSRSARVSKMAMKNGWFLQDLMSTIADQGRGLLPGYLFGDEDPEQGLQALVAALMSGRGEASGVAIAQQLLRHYHQLDSEHLRSAFFRYIAKRFAPDSTVIAQASRAYADDPSDENFKRLRNAIESPRQEFFRRLNLAPGGTAQIVRMRADLLRILHAGDLSQDDRRALAAVDTDIVHLLQSWFNRGFLVLKRIDWQTPAAILEKIIAYEAVHAIDGWDDLRRRLDPVDRRCFAYFHPSMVDEPLIFVEVALTSQMPDAIGDVLDETPKRPGQQAAPTTAVFYSISNCQEGLRGISFGNFLIKQVVEDLLDEHRGLKTFVTLSPVPRFAAWLASIDDQALPGIGQLKAAIAQTGWETTPERAEAIRPALLAAAAHYFVTARSPSGNVIDPVGRFHLGNGARLERINMLGDPSAKGLREAHGLMVNYLYEPKEIEKNHEAFANEGYVAVSRGVRNLAKPQAVRPTGATQS